MSERERGREGKREREEGRVGAAGCRRVAEVSLTLDGVPVRIVILRDAQRRGALRVSYPICRVRPSVRQQPRQRLRPNGANVSWAPSATRAAGPGY